MKNEKSVKRKIAKRASCRTSSKRKKTDRKAVQVKKSRGRPKVKAKVSKTVKRRKKGRRSKGLLELIFTKIKKTRKKLKKNSNLMKKAFVKENKKLEKKLKKLNAKMTKRIKINFDSIKKIIEKKIKKNVWSSFFAHTVLVVLLSYSVADNFVIKPEKEKYFSIITSLEQELLDEKLNNQNVAMSELKTNLSKLEKDSLYLKVKYKKLLSTIDPNHEELLAVKQNSKKLAPQNNKDEELITAVNKVDKESTSSGKKNNKKQVGNVTSPKTEAKEKASKVEINSLSIVKVEGSKELQYELKKNEKTLTNIASSEEVVKVQEGSKAEKAAKVENTVETATPISTPTAKVTEDPKVAKATEITENAKVSQVADVTKSAEVTKSVEVAQADIKPDPKVKQGSTPTNIQKAEALSKVEPKVAKQDAPKVNKAQSKISKIESKERPKLKDAAKVLSKSLEDKAIEEKLARVKNYINNNVEKKLSDLVIQILDANQDVENHKNIIVELDALCRKSSNMNSKKCDDYHHSKLILEKLLKKIALMNAKKGNLERKLFTEMAKK